MSATAGFSLRAALVAVTFAATLLLEPRAARAQLDPPPSGEETPTAKELALPNGPIEDVVFLRAVPDKTSAYVGEQVILSVYLYFRSKYEMSERHDPKYADFLRYPLLLDPGATSPVFTTVKGEPYGARLVERVALIPLRAGKLSTGAMSARFKGRDIGSRVLKASNDVVIDVIDTPEEGRPSGYVAGDVGKFTLTATVANRRIAQGGSVGVTVKIEGIGNVPPAVRLPAVKGVKWLSPQRTDSVAARAGRVAGTRTLEYLVRLETAGEVDLGAIELPTFDPVAKKYDVLKVALGVVTVDARDGFSQGGDTSPDGSRDPLAELPKPRSKPKAFKPEVEREVPVPLFALGLAGPPLLAIGLIALVRARRSVSERRRSGSAVLRDKQKSAWREAAKADKANDPRTVCAALERAVHAALEAKTSLKTRGFRVDELRSALASHGLDPEAVKESVEVLEQCEALRFIPSVDEAAIEALRGRAKALTKRLEA
ncbi:MAG: BatD family protein [Polyangiaceae bacterium]|nr:BatD family protein [Polyangiaceae bacterium]